MPIEDRNLADGTKLVLRFKGVDHHATVQKDDVGALHVRLGRKVYSSLSAAASAITHTAQNGWRAWSIVGSGAKVPAMSAQERPKRKSRAKAKTTPAAETPQVVEGDLEHPSIHDEHSVPMV